MTTEEFDAASLELARRHGKEPSFINFLLLTYLRHYVSPDRLREAINTIGPLLERHYCKGQA